MKKFHPSRLLFISICAMLLLAACGGSEPAPQTAASTLQPATSEPALTTAPAATTAPTFAPATTAPTTVAQAESPTTAPKTAAASPTTESSATTAPTVSTASDENWIDPTPGEFTSEDVNHIFPPGRGQDLVFQACVNCHNWVPLVFSQLDRGGWEQNKFNHRERVSALSDEDYDLLIEYLIQNFPPDKEPPDNIPQELLEQWTSY